MPVSEATYERLALEDDSEKWELFCGHPRKKPEGTYDHNHLARALGFMVQGQLPFDDFQVAVANGRTRIAAHYFVPDVMVIPGAFARRLRGTRGLEVYAEPLPFVAEVWSPSTGDYDVDEKFPEYRRRGDLEVWRVHPGERRITAWVRQADGGYHEREYAAGEVRLAALPVTVDLDALWA